jgi:hypothetical protein
MRKIVAGLFISLDGVVEAADQWMGPWFVFPLVVGSGKRLIRAPATSCR